MHITYLPISSIIVPEDRQRQDFDEKQIQELVDSILDTCLINPITLRDDGCTLVAGERRLRALSRIDVPYMFNGQSVRPGYVPCTTLSELDDFDLYKIEFEENYRRANLTWQESAVAFAKLRDFYATKAAREGGPLVVQDIAKDMGAASPANMARTITVNANVAKFLGDPDVAKAANLKEATAIIKRKQERILLDALNKRVIKAEQEHVCLNADALKFLTAAPAGTYNTIITDPPYGINMHEMQLQGDSNSGLVHNYDDTEEYASTCIKTLAQEGYRITTASAALYMFCDIFHFPTWQRLFQTQGWYVWPVPLIWDKSPTGSLLGNANGPRHCYEAILYAIKGNKSVNSVGEDVIKIPGPRMDKLHPAEKPVELYKRLLSWSTVPGDTVLDPFCGCGAIFPAARDLKLIAHGVEKNPEHHTVAQSRIIL